MVRSAWDEDTHTCTSYDALSSPHTPAAQAEMSGRTWPHPMAPVAARHAASLISTITTADGSTPSSRPGSAGRCRAEEGSKPPFSTKHLSLEHPRRKNDVAYTTKPIGDPAVRELNPVSPSQVIRLKHRAATLIQRYAGSNWQTAQRTKWMLDVVVHIDKDYREYIMDQAGQIQHLQRQIEAMQSNHAGVLALAQTKTSELEALARDQQAQLRESAAIILDLQTRLAESEAALTVAEQTATASAQEMRALQQQVSAITEHDARARKMLANKAHTLKEALRNSQSKLRHSTEVNRRHNMEVTAMLQLKEEEMAVEKASLSSQFMNQIAAVHMVERAAAQVEVNKIKMELDAYKEPWTYAYGRISPTKNREVTQTLGLKASSLNTIMPPV